MNKYQHGKIYKIWSPDTDQIYIGSTYLHLHEGWQNTGRSLKDGRQAKLIIHHHLPCWLPQLQYYTPRVLSL
jgi:hypothetical protein